MQRWYALGALAFSILLIWSADIYVEAARQLPKGSTPEPAAVLQAIERVLGVPGEGNGLAVSPELSVLLKTYEGRTLSLDARTQSSQCEVLGPLPDARCSPGAVFAGVGTSTICKAGYSRSVRSVSVKLKRQIYTAYSLAYPQPTGTYELDHLIPLELGGNNEPANLFPEAASPAPGFREKDLVENYLHALACAGEVSLSAAQEQIARDWTAVYKTLSPSTVSALKRQAAAYGD